MSRLRHAFLFIILFSTTSLAENAPYASETWWNGFWKSSDGWGEPNTRVISLLRELDGKKETITIVDVGAGNGRNSVSALLATFKDKKPSSRYVVDCVDSSETALNTLRARRLPDWLVLNTVKADANALEDKDLKIADIILLYGILEYVTEKNLSHVFKLAGQALNNAGYLVVVTLVKGEGALQIDGEITRNAADYTKELENLGLRFEDEPQVTQRPDLHDLGKGYPEEHLHYVYRTVLKKT